LPAGGEDPEWDPDFKGLQHELTELIDEEKVEELLATLSRQDAADARRLRELQDASVNNAWLWALNPVHGAVVPRAEFGDAVRIRIGACFTEEPILCGVWQGNPQQNRSPRIVLRLGRGYTRPLWR